MRKLVSILFALVLVLSMTLMMAVPAAAATLSPTVTFIKGGTGTAVPTTVGSHSGSGSAKLATISGDDRGMVRFEFAPGELTLDELTTLGYWEYVTTRENPLDVFIDIWLDFDGDGDADANDYPGYMQAEPYYTVGAAGLDTWTQIDAMDLMWSTYAGPDDPYHAPTIPEFQANVHAPCVHGYDMADWTNGVDFGPLSILRIDIRVGYGGTWANFTGYADDIVINDYTQGFESSVSLTVDVPDIVAISVNPTVIDFGTLNPGQTSSVESITVTNIGTHKVDVDADVYEAGLFYDNLQLWTTGGWSFRSWPVIVDDLVMGDSKVLETRLPVPSTYTPSGSETATLIFTASAA
jgi:hypothetical protein